MLLEFTRQVRRRHARPQTGLRQWRSHLASVKKRPMVVDSEVVARPSFHFFLNFDRRVMAGAQVQNSSLG